MVIALANAYSYLGKPLNKKFYNWFKQAKKDCKFGSYLKYWESIHYLSLSLEDAYDEKVIMKNGGIITIMHPIFNLHAVFVYPYDSSKCIAVNSWLGPRVCTLYYIDLKRFWRLNQANFAFRDS
jgi:hypothetical protein